MESRQIEFSQDQQPEIAMFLTERINEFNAATTGFEGEEFACVVRDDGGRIIAGANGNTWGGWCFVANLWVHESARHQGLGTALVAAVEKHSLSKQCPHIVLTSHTFQAPDFYKRLGFVEFGRIANYPIGHADVVLTKTLTTT